MALFKFLAPGGVGPFSGFVWPGPGAHDGWVSAQPPLDVCRHGLHLCRPADLPLWLHEELYAVEAAGPMDEHDGFVLAGRARLVGRVGAWHRGSAFEFSQDCARRLRDLADPRLSDHAADAASYANLAGAETGWASAATTASYIAAAAVRVAAGHAHREAAARTERARQAQWLADHVLTQWL